MTFWLLLALPFSSEPWLAQFEESERPLAAELVEHIDYFSHERICHDLQRLHQKLLPLVQDHPVVYSKMYVAKSGDLISYFYRTSNQLRSVLFKNLSDPVEDKGNKVLVLLEDYIGTGTQFLYRMYAKEHYALFNQYKKVYLAVLVANRMAIRKFDLIKTGQHKQLADDFISILRLPTDEESRERVLQMLKRIPSDRVELVYLYEEKPLPDAIRSAEKSAALAALIEKYTDPSVRSNFFKSLSIETYGHSAFFYSCPNNLPAILWDTRLQVNGKPLVPLLLRTEDSSIYESAKNFSLDG